MSDRAARHGHCDIAGKATALERRVDSLTGQRVGKPARIADHIDGTGGYSQPESANRQTEPNESG